MDTVAENIPICGSITDYLHLYINVHNGKIDDTKYLCTCDPTTNVAVEILCVLLEGKATEELKTITEDSFFKILGNRSEEISEKAKGLMELLSRGFDRLRENPA